MADYWKSQPRKFCQYCKCWIADNKPSIEFHERGKNHKENVAAKISEIKKKSVDKAKQERRMCKQFAAMEEAAMKAYEEDLKRMEMEARGLSSPILAPEKEEETPPAEETAPPPPQEKKPKKKKEEKRKKKEEEEEVWVEGQSDEGHLYYYNTRTGESRWDRPEGSIRSVVNQQNQQFQQYQQGASSAGSSGSPWMEAVSPEGYTYYYNTQTGESSWEKPPGFPSGEEPLPPGTLPEGAELPGQGAGLPVENQEVPDESVQQSSAPKISFRKRKAETEEAGKQEEEEEEEGGKAGDLVSADTTKEEETRADSEQNPPEQASVQSSAADPGQTEVKEPEVKIQVKRRRTVNPYGAWEKIKEEKDPYSSVDLQLPPAAEPPPGPPALPPEPRPRFKERVITSLGNQEEEEEGAGPAGGGEPATFRKSRALNGRGRRLRQRDDDN
ncbi:WW domain-binding protein 4 [Salarias fasciatus]|uniref:WW domain-binding protein 4-like n=1 Tax=Salarias fasciatus TaxID=181472 RepID=A0A672J359_SALFA|nr:WW domain-binding protein 4-like [Salarias fasciatus]